jgi:TatD DNase family protein
MDYAYTYGDASRLYLNVTNRCSARCLFCVRNHSRGLGGHELWGGGEPDCDTLLQTVEQLGGPEAFPEIVWCGFGEPTYRLDLILELSPLFRRRGSRVRLNTNGHANLIHQRDVWPELGPVLDEVSVSLNAPTLDRYLELCRPLPSPAPGLPALPPESYWEAVLDFLRRAPLFVPSVQASVVGSALSPKECEAARVLALSLGIQRFRVR